MSTIVPGPAPIIQVRSLVKHFRRADGSTVRAIDGVDLDVGSGEFIVLLGPSGCGKTTLLRAVAGLEEPDSGEIRIRDRVCYSSAEGVHLSPEQRGLSMIFQSYALWPHMTVAQNVAYPMLHGRSEGGKPKKDEVARRVEEALGLVGIGDLRDQYPSQISGGQQQRVALARALVGRSDLVLFDEPLSNVDAKVREQLRYELIELQNRIGFAALYVTHDQEEAMSMADRIAVLDLGRIVQLGKPRNIYFDPANRYVAGFVGKSNEVPGVVRRVDAEVVVVETRAGTVTATAPRFPVAPGEEVIVNWRPEACSLRREDPGEANTFSGQVVTSVFLGAVEEWRVHLADRVVVSVVSRSDRSARLEPGAKVWITVPPGRVRLLVD